MSSIRLIAFDLDQTALNMKKEVTPETLRALTAAARAGIVLVPATGRFASAIPEVIRRISRYAITVNGAQVCDMQAQRALSKNEIPWEEAAAIMETLDGLGLQYDCYQNNWGYITRQYFEEIPTYYSDPGYLMLLRTLRTPVPELKAFLRDKKEPVQKLLIYTHTPQERLTLLERLPGLFPNYRITSSMPQVMELNAMGAHKGAGLCQLAKALQIPIAQTMAVGDGLNDKTMLEAAGVAVAMANSDPPVLAVADYITEHCDDDGFAHAVWRAMDGTYK